MTIDMDNDNDIDMEINEQIVQIKEQIGQLKEKTGHSFTITDQMEEVETNTKMNLIKKLKKLGGLMPFV